MKWLKNIFITHRGYYNNIDIPENSILAFKKSVDLKYAIELDLMLTQDEEIIVFHDKSLLRLCGINKNIKDVDSSFIKEMRLLNTKEKIPFLKEVLEEIDGKVPLIIEIKKYERIGVLEKKLLELLKTYNGNYVVCSFEKDILNWFKINYPSIKRGLIFEGKNKRTYLLNFLYNYLSCNPDFVSLNYELLDSNILKYCKKKNILTMTWSINSIRNLKKSEKKVDSIIFEKISP